MTKKETIQVLQSIEDRAVDFPYMTACGWVAIAAAKRHLENSLETKNEGLEEELAKWRHSHFHGRRDADATGEYLERASQLDLARHFFELGMTSKYKAIHDDTPLTDFEKAFQGMCCDKNKQFAKECCAELIALAKKQILTDH